MITTPRAIEQMSDRIEQAYLRRRPEWRQAGLDPRLWSAAAAMLMDARLQEPWVPLDPELFVTCQTTGPRLERPVARADPGRVAPPIPGSGPPDREEPSPRASRGDSPDRRASSAGASRWKSS